MCTIFPSDNKFTHCDTTHTFSLAHNTSGTIIGELWAWRHRQAISILSYQHNCLFKWTRSSI